MTGGLIGRRLFKLIAILSLVACLFAAGCHTMNGFGKDMEGWGKDIQDASS